MLRSHVTYSRPSILHHFSFLWCAARARIIKRSVRLVPRLSSCAAFPSKRVTLAGWEHENGAFWIAGSSYLASNHGSRCLLSLPSLPPCSLIEKRARLAFFFLTELAWPSKGAIEQVTGLDLFAWSTEQPWGNPCSPCVAPAQTAGGDIGDVNLKRSSVRFCLCAFSLIDRLNIEPSVCACVKRIA